MRGKRGRAGVRVRAFAKLNLTLQVLGPLAGGYHELRTTFQSLALHDTLTFTARRGAFTIDCDDPQCPRDESNLVWRAAERLWRESGKPGTVHGVHVRLIKRIPSQAGLGGGSSDAAAALRALAALWRLPTSDDRLRAIGADIGADVPFFLDGGTALGLERGDLLFPLIDAPASSVVIARPNFGVSTREAYAWWDLAPSSALPNNLEPPVVARHPEIGRLIARLRRAGATAAAMSGSGSAVFGLFRSDKRAKAAAAVVEGRGVLAIVTRTLNRARYQRLARPSR